MGADGDEMEMETGMEMRWGAKTPGQSETFGQTFLIDQGLFPQHII